MNPREAHKRVLDLTAKVREHPMCLRLEDSPQSATVFFPAGDFPTHGIRASYGAGKAVGLQRMLDAMERIWLESFPGYRSEPA